MFNGLKVGMTALVRLQVSKFICLLALALPPCVGTYYSTTDFGATGYMMGPDLCVKYGLVLFSLLFFGSPCAKNHSPDVIDAPSYVS